MIGTLVNCATILTGSFIGSRLKKGIREEHQEIMMQAMGLAATALGINAIVKYMPQSEYPVLFIVSLALGGLLGEKIHLEDKFKKFVTGFSNGNLAQGLSTAILLFCVGTLSILGPMESALRGDNTYLFTNAMLDFVTSSVLASTFGFGIALAAIVLFFWQGIFLLPGTAAGRCHESGDHGGDFHYRRYPDLQLRPQHPGNQEFQNHEYASRISGSRSVLYRQIIFINRKSKPRS